MTLTTYLNVMSKLRMHGAIPPLPLDMVFNQAQLFDNEFNQNYFEQQQWL